MTDYKKRLIILMEGQKKLAENLMDRKINALKKFNKSLKKFIEEEERKKNASK